MTLEKKRVGVMSWIAGLLVGLAFPSEGGVSVVIDGNPPNDVLFSAHDLGSHLTKMLGQDVPVCDAAAVSPDAVRIEVGTAAAKERALAAAKTLASGESAAVCDGKAVYIWGEGQMGTANGVYAYLEDRLGCRWFTPWDEPVVPARASLPLGAFADVNRPKLTERWILTIDGCNQLTRNGMLFQYRNGLNAMIWSSYQNVDLPPGCGPLRPEVFCPNPMVHSIFLRLPPHGGKPGETGYFDEHPDWYSMDANGKRVDTMQVCFSNRGLREELTKVMLKAIDQCGGKGYFDLSQRDEHGDGFCLCPACKALVAKYGTPGAPLFDYLKELGAKLETERPGAFVHFLSYRKTQTQVPPNEAFGRFPDNVIPVFAPIDDDFSKDLTHPNNAETYRNFQRWSAITRHSWVWYYPLAYSGGFTPFLAIRRWTKDLRLLADAGLTGGSFEHDVGYPLGINFADLQAWLIAKLYVHPNRPVGRLISDFCRYYYGAAAPDILEYIRELETITAEHKGHLIWNSLIPYVLDAPHLIRWTEAFDAMERKVAGDPVVLQRLRECRAGVDFYMLKKYAKLKSAGYKVPPEVFRDRLTNTLERACERRCPGKEKNAFGQTLKWNPTARNYQSVLKVVSGAYTIVSHDAPLPERFAKLPEKDIFVIPNTGGAGGVHPQPLADAAYGMASWCKEDTDAEKGFTVGFWDEANKKFGSSVTLRPEDVKKPDRFEFYRVGVISPSPSCYVFPGYTCRVRSQLEECYTPGEPEYWELWVSLKFEGPRYKGSKAAENKVWYDRTVLVRTKKPKGK